MPFEENCLAMNVVRRNGRPIREVKLVTKSLFPFRKPSSPYFVIFARSLFN